MDAEAVDQETYKQRHWDDWKDDNPKGGSIVCGSLGCSGQGYPFRLFGLPRAREQERQGLKN
jgi:hypothetical protein